MTWSRRGRRDVGDSDGMASDHHRRRVGVGVWCIPVWIHGALELLCELRDPSVENLLGQSLCRSKTRVLRHWKAKLREVDLQPQI